MFEKIIVTNDICLKKLSEEEIDAIFQTIDTQREYLGEWLPFVDYTQEISDTEYFVENEINSDPKDTTFAIYYQDEFAGLIGLKDTDLVNKKTEIGYWLSQPFQGKGIITTCCKLLINHAFDKMEMNRIQIKAAIGNIKSQKVAERLGFSQEGVEREGEKHSKGYFDLAIFSLLKKEYQKN